MGAPKNDKTSGTTSTPFSTADGKVPSGSTPITKGTDFTKDPIGQSRQAGGRDFMADSNRKQASQPVEGMGSTPPQDMSIPQRAGTPAERVSMQDAGRGGPGMIDSDSTRARGATAGVAHNPMKLGGGAPAKPAPAPAPSAARASASLSQSSASQLSGDQRDTIGFPPIRPRGGK
jgi:hypothetical protein